MTERSFPEPLDTVSDLAGPARAIMGEAAWSFLTQTAEDGLTARRERAALDAVVLRPRVLRDVTGASTSCRLLGHDLDAPILAAPTALQGHAHPDAEVATVGGCRDAGTLAIVSSVASRPLAEVAAVGAPWWFQLYPMTDRGLTAEAVRIAVAAGASAIVVTVDVPVPGRRPAITDPLPDTYVALHDALRAAGETDVDLLPRIAGRALTWDEMAWLRDVVGDAPIVIKGVLDPDDAARLVQAPVDALVVSTHGGRQLDGAPAPAEVLPAIVERVQGRLEVFADGSVRRGSDVLRLLVRGADAVLVGRPIVWGLACGGRAGVRRVVEHLTGELRTAMALTGCTSVEEAGPDLEWRGP